MVKFINNDQKEYKEIIDNGVIVGHNGTGAIYRYNGKFYSLQLNYMIEI